MEAPAYPPHRRSGPVRWRRLLPLFTIMPLIALILSGVITWINLGWVDGFVQRWLLAFLIALPVMPFGLGTMLLIEKAMGPRLQFLPRLASGLVLSLCTAMVMEAFMASAVTLSNNGLGPAFPGQWASAFWRSLPVGLLISLLMGFVIKPRLARLTGEA